MKKLTLLVAAALMITGGAFAQEKACCKKGGKCTKECSKDKKATAKDSKSTTTNKTEPAKKSS